MRNKIHPSTKIVLFMLALVGLIHMAFLWIGTYKTSYDAYIHIFFSSHWVNNWWGDIEPRWFTGFSVFSYPPFSHQLLALPGFIFNLDWVFLVVQSGTIIAFALGIYRYSRIWFSHKTSLLALLLCGFSSSLAITVHLFGQYPNTVSLALMLNVIPFMRIWVIEGKKTNLAISIFLFIPAIFTSLFSNLFGFLFFAAPVIIDCILLFSPLKIHILKPNETAKRGGLIRLVILFLAALALAFICLSPFFYYLQVSPFEQVPIPHASRENLLEWSEVNYFMFYGLYGLTLISLPITVLYMVFKRRYMIFLPSTIALFLLSLGGTFSYNTRLPANLFYILTFDRFSFWISILIIPLTAHLLLITWQKFRTTQVRRYFCLGLYSILGSIYLGLFLVNSSSPFWKNLIPANDQEMQALVQVMGQEKYRSHRYISLGIGGHNFARLSAQIKTPSLDGNYHFARRVSEMNQVPMGMLEESKYYDLPGINALAKILLNPNKYQLKYIIVKDKYYELLLNTAGWYKLKNITNDIVLWTTKTKIDPVPSTPLKQSPLAYRLIWGLGPLSSFAIALLFIGLRLKKEPEIYYES